MSTSDILTTRIGDQVKVEIWTPDHTTTLTDYGVVTPRPDAGNVWTWTLYSGESGAVATTERDAINAAARAIRRAHARQGAPAVGYPIDDDTIRQLFETLIWQANDGQTALDDLGFTRDDMPLTEQAKVVEAFRTWCAANRDDVAAYCDHTDRMLEAVAHDWILTRNGHGTGLWDRCTCDRDDTTCPGNRLTDTLYTADEIEVEVGDDGRLYVFGNVA